MGDRVLERESLSSYDCCYPRNFEMFNCVLKALANHGLLRGGTPTRIDPFKVDTNRKGNRVNKERRNWHDDEKRADALCREDQACVIVDVRGAGLRIGDGSGETRGMTKILWPKRPGACLCVWMRGK